MPRILLLLSSVATLFACSSTPEPAIADELPDSNREIGEPFPGDFGPPGGDTATDSADDGDMEAPSDASPSDASPSDAQSDTAPADTAPADTATADTATADTAPADIAPAERGVRVEDGVLFVDGSPFEIRGVAWNPVARGGIHPADLDFAGYVEQDGALMETLGLNVVRTYEPITDHAVLDSLYARGIYVINSVYNFGGHDPEFARAPVEATRDHPAVLMWTIGNEWNYNGLYASMPIEDATERVSQVAEVIRDADPSRPIATIFGEMPWPEVIEALPEIDVWGLNVYRGIGFGDLFDAWTALTDRPMFVAEFGADAWNANVGREDQPAQAEASVALFREIEARSAAAGPGPSLGGTIFEWADEWWKDVGGTPDNHDTGGIAPGGGPHPDATFNEEWWGLVDIERVPRQAYMDLRDHWAR